MCGCANRARDWLRWLGYVQASDGWWEKGTHRIPDWDLDKHHFAYTLQAMGYSAKHKVKEVMAA